MMLKRDALGQQIGPGDIVLDMDRESLWVVNRSYSESGDFVGVEVMTLRSEFPWDEPEVLYHHAMPHSLVRISDYSDVSEPVANQIRDLENLYMTITGERYG